MSNISTRLFGLLLLVCAGCSAPDTVSWAIQGKRFNIPRENVVDAGVSFLPASQDALRFVINPSAPLREQHMVSIDPSATCPPFDGSEPRNPRCKVTPTLLSQLERAKLIRAGDEFTWQYRSAETGRVVASCSAAEGDGLCNHYGLYEGIPYRIGFRDSQLPRLVSLRRTTEALMREWQAK